VVDNFLRQAPSKESIHTEKPSSRKIADGSEHEEEKSRRTNEGKSNLVTIASLVEENAILMKYLQKQ